MRWHLRGSTAAALVRLSRGPFSPRHSLLRDTPPPGPCCDGHQPPLPNTHTSLWRRRPHSRLDPRAGPASHSLKRPRGASPLLELCCPDGGAPTGDMEPPPISAVTGLLAGLVGGDGAPSLGGASCSSAVERLRKEGEVLRLSELPFYDLAGLLTPLIASSLGAPAASVRSFLHLNEIPEFKPATPKAPSPPTPQTTPQPLGSAHSGEQHSGEQHSGESRRRSPRGLVAPGGPIGGSTPTDPAKGVALPPPEA